MMAENPNNWWSMMNPSPLIHPQYVLGPSSPSIPFNPFTEIIPEHSQSWSQLLFIPEEEERLGFSNFQSKKLVENNNNNWDDDQNTLINNNTIIDVIKYEGVSQCGSNNLYCHEEFQASSSCCSQDNNNNNLLDFSYNNKNKNPDHRKNQLPCGSSKCNNSTTTAGVCNKKARSQPPLKVRKEKLGDRITALHQLVSPFGKTDTASVLFEAIGYITFLHTQIEALSSPYLANGSKNNTRNQYYVHGEKNCVFPEDPGQLLNDNGLNRKVASRQDAKDKTKDLRNRGLCLVPVTCTQHVGNENGSDYYWAPSYAGGYIN